MHVDIRCLQVLISTTRAKDKRKTNIQKLLTPYLMPSLLPFHICTSVLECCHQQAEVTFRMHMHIYALFVYMTLFTSSALKIFVFPCHNIYFFLLIISQVCFSLIIIWTSFLLDFSSEFPITKLLQLLE